MTFNESIGKIMRQGSMLTVSLFFASNFTFFDLDKNQHFLAPEDHTHTEVRVDDAPYNRLVVSGSTYSTESLYQALSGYYSS